MFRRTRMASAIAVLTARVTAATKCPQAFLTKGPRHLAMPRPFMAGY
jgi:hypothetical protein